MTRWHDLSVALDRAEGGQVGDVLAVLDKAPAWLDSTGVRQWPSRFEHQWVSPAIEQGHTWLARLDGELAATITLDWGDPARGTDDQFAGQRRMAQLPDASDRLGPRRRRSRPSRFERSETPSPRPQPV